MKRGSLDQSSIGPTPCCATSQTPNTKHQTPNIAPAYPRPHQTKPHSAAYANPRCHSLDTSEPAPPRPHPPHSPPHRSRTPPASPSYYSSQPRYHCLKTPQKTFPSTTPLPPLPPRPTAPLAAPLAVPRPSAPPPPRPTPAPRPTMPGITFPPTASYTPSTANRAPAIRPSTAPS